MSESSWYRSLYWRVALGFVLFLGGVLAVQAAVLLWSIERGSSASGPPPRGFTVLVSRDLSSALAANPSLDIEHYLRETYQQRVYPFMVVMKDGRVITIGASPPSTELVQEARSWLERPLGRGPEGGREPRARRDGLVFERFGRGGPGRMGFGPPGDVIVAGERVGVVVAIPRSILSELGPRMAYTGVGLVLAGTTLAALLIFGPVRRRLRDLEGAARRIGAGDLTARAPEDGGDEVAGLARAFNRMAEDLRMRADQVQAADRARRLLLADVSHELMTPLTAMRGYLETLSMPELAVDAETRTRFVGIVSDESRRLERIVGDLVDLARLEGGGESLDLQDVPIESLFGRVVARHERDADGKRVGLSTTIAPGAEIVYGDPLRLEQALQNLAANALRHTPPGGRVELTAEIQGGEVVLSVRDTGPGIPPEHLALVFERFYKVDPSRAHGATGSGLGLSIVKAIAERHGGTIAVSNAQDGGSIFTIRLPAAGDLKSAAGRGSRQ